MHKILDWKSSDDTRDIVHIVVQSLVEGKNVVLPAETAYHLVASGLNPRLSVQFHELAQSGQIGRSAIYLRSAQELMDYATDLSPVAIRMARRGWPGPLVLELPVTDGRSLMNRLPKEIQTLVMRNDGVAYRVAAHPSIQQALRLMPGPLVAAPILQNSVPVHSAHETGELAGSSIIVDDGKMPLNDLATVVRVDGNRCEVVSQGALAGEALYRIAQFVVLLVCTGNTCRSPMAEALLREKFARRFPTSKNGACAAFVASGGLSAYPGGPASIEAQNVMVARGLSLADHQSRAITQHALQLADLILVMTQGHRAALLDSLPEIKSKVHLLSGNSTDISDPFGGPEASYAACADQIDACLEQWNAQLPDSFFPVWSQAAFQP